MVVVLLMPVMAIISLVFILASHPLYPYYTALPLPWGGRAHALSNQALAGAIMWVPSSLVSLAAVFYICVEWFRQDEARQLRLEALEDAGRLPARRPGSSWAYIRQPAVVAADGPDRVRRDWPDGPAHVRGPR